MTPIEYKTVDSTNLAMVGYDKQASLLEITFQSGLTYRYYQVEEIIYERLMKAESKGKYFNTWIRGNYKYTKVGRM